MLSARNRMKRSTEFDATVKRGIRAAQPHIVVHVRLVGEQDVASAPRVGLIVGKSVGSAVERHRVSRRLRHVARSVLGDLQGCDRLVIRALPGSRTASSERLAHELRRGVRRALKSAGRQP